MKFTKQKKKRGGTEGKARLDYEFFQGLQVLESICTMAHQNILKTMEKSSSLPSGRPAAIQSHTGGAPLVFSYAFL